LVLGDLLDRIGRRSAGLSIDDIAAVVGDALKSQKRDLIAHMQRMIQLERVNSKPNDTRARNLHARLTAAESAIRILQKDRSR
jgi:hypothetical protein